MGTHIRYWRVQLSDGLRAADGSGVFSQRTGLDARGAGRDHYVVGAHTQGRRSQENRLEWLDLDTGVRDAFRTHSRAVQRRARPGMPRYDDNERVWRLGVQVEGRNFERRIPHRGNCRHLLLRPRPAVQAVALVVLNTSVAHSINSSSLEIP